MSATAEHADGHDAAVERLGLEDGLVVQEIGYDDDCDDDLRAAIEDRIGGSLVDEDYEEDVVDVVLLWWRESDGDLTDGLLNVRTALADGGVVWLLTPKAGRDEHIEPSEIGEAAVTAGLSATSGVSAAAEWVGTKLVAPKAKGKK